MWKSLYGTARTLLRLADDLRENREEIKELRLDLHELTLAVERLAGRVAHVSEREERERAMLMLQMENSLLRGRQGLLVGGAEPAG
ncbi:MAG TPA: hypothetical protein VFR37_05705 [Longimicrobium sp.]|nr:hypothetical protein [Longimicrobium sp.]